MNLALGLALIVRSVLQPLLLSTFAAPMCASICANTRALALGGNVQDGSCLRGFDDFNAPCITELIRITFPV